MLNKILIGVIVACCVVIGVLVYQNLSYRNEILELQLATDAKTKTIDSLLAERDTLNESLISREKELAEIRSSTQQQYDFIKELKDVSEEACTWFNGCIPDDILNGLFPKSTNGNTDPKDPSTSSGSLSY